MINLGWQTPCLGQTESTLALSSQVSTWKVSSKFLSTDPKGDKGDKWEEYISPKYKLRQSSPLTRLPSSARIRNRHTQTPEHQCHHRNLCGHKHHHKHLTALLWSTQNAFGRKY